MSVLIFDNGYEWSGHELLFVHVADEGEEKEAAELLRGIEHRGFVVGVAPSVEWRVPDAVTTLDAILSHWFGGWDRLPRRLLNKYRKRFDRVHPGEVDELLATEPGEPRCYEDEKCALCAEDRA